MQNVFLFIIFYSKISFVFRQKKIYKKIIAVNFIKNKKKPFILIESLLAIGIIGLTLSTLLQSPAKLFKKNIDALCEMELCRESQRLFFSIERSFKENHSFISLSLEPKKFFLKDLVLEMTPHCKRQYKSYYELSIKKENTADYYKTR